MELTLEKSQECADIIEAVKQYVYIFDNEYAKELVSAMIDQTFRQQSIAVLNPSYSQTRNTHLHQQALTLKHFTEFVDGLKKSEELKKQVLDAERTQREINSLFV